MKIRMNKENIIKCPVCGSQSNEEVLQLKDYFLSGEKYGIHHCNDCQLRFTFPRPDIDKIGSYYKSDEYISHTNSKKGLLNGVYQLIRSYNLKSKFSYINQFSNGKSILDIGCATGEFLNYFKHFGWQTKGIEPEISARELAINNYQLDVKDEMELDNILPESFDIISMWHVLEHVYHLEERIIQLHKILKNDGYCFIALPNYLSYDAEYYNEFWAAYDVPRHLYHFDILSLLNLMERFGFKLEETKPMKFDSFYVSMLSEKYKNNKPNILKAFRIGMKSNFKAMKSGKYSSLIYVFSKQPNKAQNV